MQMRFYKTGDVNGSSYVKIPLRSNAILNLENINKKVVSYSQKYFIYYLHPCEKSHPSKVKKL